MNIKHRDELLKDLSDLSFGFKREILWNLRVNLYEDEKHIVKLPFLYALHYLVNDITMDPHSHLWGDVSWEHANSLDLTDM